MRHLLLLPITLLSVITVTLGVTFGLFTPLPSLAAEQQIEMFSISSQGIGDSIGSVIASDSPQGLVIKPSLHGLPAGEHGFHLHEIGDCGPGEKDGVALAGLAAGGHWDPDKTGKHLGPDGDGHRGDLSRLSVSNLNNEAIATARAPRLEVSDLYNKALIIHAGGDNYSDTPPLGGGGQRIACGTSSIQDN
ncbi:MAG: Superoxide dismutase [Cu-Zn] [Prochlorococcus marinus str. MIT 9215]|jgi:Cu-Zn family superoxide dismutase|nr:MAG: Superoxide dismutase [Cu-Zn] [Prochlorococcus marinus str. MIT 9215]